MSHFEDWQRQKDQEDDSYPDPMITVGVLIATIFTFALIILVGTFAGGSEEDACEEIGGTFTVVGEEFSAALKRTIDIYGCVK